MFALRSCCWSCFLSSSILAFIVPLLLPHFCPPSSFPSIIYHPASWFVVQSADSSSPRSSTTFAWSLHWRCPLVSSTASCPQQCLVSSLHSASLPSVQSQPTLLGLAGHVLNLVAIHHLIRLRYRQDLGSFSSSLPLLLYDFDVAHL